MITTISLNTDLHHMPSFIPDLSCIKKKMERTIPKLVKDVMTTNLFLLNKSDSLRKAQTIFKKFKVRHLPVLEGGNLIGMLSHTDIMRLSFGDIYGPKDEDTNGLIYDDLTIEQVMCSHPKTVSQYQNISEVAYELIRAEFHALPVVDDDKLLGIITTTDVIQYLLLAYESRFFGESAISSN